MSPEESFKDWLLQQLTQFVSNATQVSLHDSDDVSALLHLLGQFPNGPALFRGVLVREINRTAADIGGGGGGGGGGGDPHFRFLLEEVEAAGSGSAGHFVFACEDTNGADEDQVIVADHFAFWLEAVGQSALGLFGVAFNLIGLSLLMTSRRLRSVFNSMLSALLLLHTAYILVSTTLVLRMWTESYFLDLLFTHFLYPLKPMLMHAATFLTVLMARERFLAIRHPLEYRNSTAGVNPWRTAGLKALLPVTVAAAIFVSPLYFESKQVTVTRAVFIKQPDGNTTTMNMTVHELQVTPLRVDSDYVMWYKNVASLAVTIIFPFVLLVHYNSKTLSVIKRRHRMRNRPYLGSVVLSTGSVSSRAPSRCVTMLVLEGQEADDDRNDANDEVDVDGECRNTASSSTYCTDESKSSCSGGGKRSDGAALRRRHSLAAIPLNDEVERAKPPVVAASTSVSASTGVRFAVSSDLSLASFKIRSQRAKREEAKKARILFAIVLVFGACNALRVLLNVEECYSQRAYQEAADRSDCNPVPMWALMANSVSQFLLAVNATLGVVVYGVMSKEFRKEMARMLSATACHFARKSDDPGGSASVNEDDNDSDGSNVSLEEERKSRRLELLPSSVASAAVPSTPADLRKGCGGEGAALAAEAAEVAEARLAAARVSFISVAESTLTRPSVATSDMSSSMSSVTTCTSSTRSSGRRNGSGNSSLQLKSDSDVNAIDIKEEDCDDVTDPLLAPDVEDVAKEVAGEDSTQVQIHISKANI